MKPPRRQHDDQRRCEAARATSRRPASVTSDEESTSSVSIPLARKIGGEQQRGVNSCGLRSAYDKYVHGALLFPSLLYR